MRQADCPLFAMHQSSFTGEYLGFFPLSISGDTEIVEIHRAKRFLARTTYLDTGTWWWKHSIDVSQENKTHLQRILQKFIVQNKKLNTKSRISLLISGLSFFSEEIPSKLWSLLGKTSKLTQLKADKPVEQGCHSLASCIHYILHAVDRHSCPLLKTCEYLSSQEVTHHRKS